MADNVSIVMTMKTNIEETLKSIANTSHGCSKEFEEFQRRATELGTKFGGLNTRYEDFNKRSAEASAKAEKFKLEMSAMTKEARASGQELNQVKFENLKKQYREAADDARGYANAAKDTLKEMKLIEDETRKMELAAPEIASWGGSSSVGFMSSLFNGDIGGRLAQSGLLQMAGDSLSNAIGVFAESALGQPLATLGSGIASGAASGAAAGALMGPWGAVLGGLGGAALGGFNGWVQMEQSKDESFKDYYRSLYEDTNAATAERLSSGTTLAAGREDDLRTLTSLLGGDQDAAKDFQAAMVEIGRTPPFSYDTAVSLSRDMLGLGLGADKVIDRINGLADAAAALGLSDGNVSSIVSTLESAHSVYTWDYGNEVESLIGQPFTPAVKRSEAVRYVREALLVNPYIRAVRQVDVTFGNDDLTICCEAETIYGEVRVYV